MVDRNDVNDSNISNKNAYFVRTPGDMSMILDEDTAVNVSSEIRAERARQDKKTRKK